MTKSIAGRLFLALVAVSLLTGADSVGQDGVSEEKLASMQQQLDAQGAQIEQLTQQLNLHRALESSTPCVTELG